MKRHDGTLRCVLIAEDLSLLYIAVLLTVHARPVYVLYICNKYGGCNW